MLSNISACEKGKSMMNFKTDFRTDTVALGFRYCTYHYTSRQPAPPLVPSI